MNYINRYQCDVCLRCESVSVIPLMSHERLLAAKLIKKFKTHVHLLNLPSLACENCFHKVILLQSFFRKLFKEKRDKISINDIMQQHTISPVEKEEKAPSLQMETKKEEEESTQTPQRDHCSVSVTNEEGEQRICSSNYSCTCESCQSKFGALPILLQGIERKTMEESMEIHQPSTSSGACSDPTDKLLKKSLSCQYCNKCFHHKGDYNKHLRKHTKEKPFSCSVCDRKFSHTSNLQRHFRLHSGQKPFSCKNCEKKFSRKDKLESHKKSRLCQNRTNKN